MSAIRLPEIRIPSIIRRIAAPQPCTDEIIPVGDWCVVALPQGLFEGVLKWKDSRWGKAVVEIQVSFHGETFIRRVTVYEANIRRMSCWLADETAAPHLVDNYIW